MQQQTGEKRVPSGLDGESFKRLSKGPEMSANDKQVGGNHYRKVEGEQHWDRQWRLYGRGYFVGCITKYIERYPDKNGMEDLLKAQQFLEKLIELESRSKISSNNPYANIKDTY